MRGIFVTGTDTGVGKTIVSAALVSAMAAAGERVRAFKPVVTGVEAHPSPDAREWPPDHELLASAAGMAAGEVSPRLFEPAVSPHLAAEMAGAPIDPERLVAAARASAAGATLVVEGVGGLLVPLTDSCSVRDLAVALELRLVVVARPGLGTINHTLLTLEAARAAGLDVRAVVLTPWPAQPTVLERSNRETIASIGDVAVATLGRVPSPSRSDLAVAGNTLPWRQWC